MSREPHAATAVPSGPRSARARPVAADCPPGPLPAVIAASLAAALLALNVYRAATQSVTHDEALTFEWYLAGPLPGIFERFQANNHVLHTLLAWCSVRAFGLSEFTLRLPSLLGGALLLGAGLGLCRALLGRGWCFLCGFALLALNPLLLDFLSAARGYGLALGLMLVAALQLVREPVEPATADAGPAARSRRRLVGASLAAGLSVCANLTLAPACAGLLVMALVLPAARPAPGDRLRRGVALLLPGALVFAALMTRPLLAARAGSFFLGLPSFAESSLDLVSRSLTHPGAGWSLDTGSALRSLEHELLAWIGVPLLLVLLALRVARAIGDTRDAGPQRRGLTLLGGALLLALLLTALLHALAGVPWPADRTGLPAVVLGSLCAAALARDLFAAGRERPGALRLASALPAALLALLALQMAAQLQVTRYALWPHEAGLRNVFEELVAREQPAAAAPAAPAPPRRVVITDWRYEPALNFYRFLHRARWMQTIERDAPQPGERWDYLIAPSPESAVAAGAEVLFTEPLAGTVLAVPIHER